MKTARAIEAETSVWDSLIPWIFVGAVVLFYSAIFYGIHVYFGVSYKTLIVWSLGLAVCAIVLIFFGFASFMTTFNEEEEKDPK